MKDSPETLRTIIVLSSCWAWGGPLIGPPLCRRDASFSNSRCKFPQSGKTWSVSKWRRFSWYPARFAAFLPLGFFLHTREIDPESCKFKPNLYSNYSLPIDWTPNRIPFGAISIVRVSLQSKFGLNLKDSELISLCAISCIIWWQLFVGRLMLINRSLDNGKWLQYIIILSLLMILQIWYFRLMTFGMDGWAMRILNIACGKLLMQECRNNTIL